MPEAQAQPAHMRVLRVTHAWPEGSRHSRVQCDADRHVPQHVTGMCPASAGCKALGLPAMVEGHNRQQACSSQRQEEQLAVDAPPAGVGGRRHKDAWLRAMWQPGSRRARHRCQGRLAAVLPLAWVLSIFDTRRLETGPGSPPLVRGEVAAGLRKPGRPTAARGRQAQIPWHRALAPQRAQQSWPWR